jgi:hypothetical protein
LRAQGAEAYSGKIRVSEIIGDAQRLHVDPDNEGALFQVASQFNLLEMVSPDVTPEHGVDIYEQDRTQGPACAIAAGAGTIYRNYFVPVNGHIGQSAFNQIDCLRDLGHALGNDDGRLWEMTNGYALASEPGLEIVSRHLASCSDADRDELRKLLRIGIQWNTEVTIAATGHCVSQAYCSALPVAYSSYPAERWEQFARLVLEACYEATLCAGIINAENTGNDHVYLTKVGGGAFGNGSAWITDAMQRALDLYRDSGLDIAIVSFRYPDNALQPLLERFR